MQTIAPRGNHLSFALKIDALPAYVMTPDAEEQASSVVSYRDVAPPMAERIPAVSFHRIVVDGIVRNKDGEIPWGGRRRHPSPGHCQRTVRWKRPTLEGLELSGKLAHTEPLTEYNAAQAAALAQTGQSTPAYPRRVGLGLTLLVFDLPGQLPCATSGTPRANNLMKSAAGAGRAIRYP